MARWFKLPNTPHMLALQVATTYASMGRPVQVIFNHVSYQTSRFDVLTANIFGMLLFLCISVVLFYAHIRHHITAWSAAVSFTKDTPIEPVT